jgi:4-diphosphocytidyl-2-C-methyl-D-erythritol kinase
MSTYEAPAKLNLSLIVSPPRDDGYHPIESLVQTVEWCDLLEVERGQEGRDTFESDFDDDLVERAMGELRVTFDVPPLAMSLAKVIPVAAGMGGGSSDAAAALMAGSDFGRLDRTLLPPIAARVGADVPLFLTGGTLMVAGIGDDVNVMQPLVDTAVAIVVPEFGIATKDVYERWDAMEGPEGSAVPDDRLPPTLRGGRPMRNDLLPAALVVEPRLGDFMADVTSVWGTTVCLTGSGSACFGYFAAIDEAVDAAAAVAGQVKQGRGVSLRPFGVRKRHSSGEPTSASGRS